MENQQKLIITILAGVIAVALLLVGWFYFGKDYFQKPVPSPPTAEPPPTLGSEISKQIESPAEKLPETNPFEAKTNPFGDTKTNPYTDVYKNPFQ